MNPFLINARQPINDALASVQQVAGIERIGMQRYGIAACPRDEVLKAFHEFSFFFAQTYGKLICEILEPVRLKSETPI